MINEKNLEKIYEEVITGNDLTTKKLITFGFNFEDLKELIKVGILERKEIGLYQLLDVDKLFCYGKKLLSDKKYKKATKCFQKCYELNPNHLSTCFQLFLTEIQNEKYENAFKYLKIFFVSNNETFIRDINFFLLLLNSITTIPSEYRKYVQNLEFKDIKIENSNSDEIDDIEENNKIRLSVINAKLKSAFPRLNQMLSKKENVSYQDILIKQLLYIAIRKEIQIKAKIMDFIKQKDFKQLKEYLKNLSSRKILTKYELTIQKLVNDMLNIMSTGKIPEKKTLDTKSVFVAIDNKNYELALELYEANISNPTFDGKNNVIYLLLKEISCIISRSQKSNTTLSPKKDEDSTIISSTSEEYDDINLINQKMRELEQNGIVILNSMSEERMERIYKITSTMSNVGSFYIGTDENKRIVLKLKNTPLENIDISETVKKGNRYYYNEEYEKFIPIYRQLLKNLANPSSNIFVKLGLAYLKISEKSTAISYLTVATEIRDKGKNSFDFTDLIVHLNSEENYEVEKPEVKIVENDFINDLNNYYGINNIFEIAELVSNGVSTDEACRAFGLNDEQNLIVYLIFAREYYSEDNVLMGDLYMKIVEKSKNKTRLVNSIFNEIRRNKMFYKHRVSKDEFRLTLH